MTQVGSALSWLLAQHQRLRVDKAEGINNDLSLNGLDRIDNDGDSAGRQLLKRLLGVDIDR